MSPCNAHLVKNAARRTLRWAAPFTPGASGATEAAAAEPNSRMVPSGSSTRSRPRVIGAKEPRTAFWNSETGCRRAGVDAVAVVARSWLMILKQVGRWRSGCGGDDGDPAGRRVGRPWETKGHFSNTGEAPANGSA